MELSKEEILALLEQNNIDIRTLAQEAKKVKNETPKEKAERTQKNEATWNITMNKYPDFAVTKTVGNNWKMLVAMVSQGTLFIKDKKGSEVANKQTVTGFFKGMEKILPIENQWLTELKAGADFARSIVEVFSEPLVLEGIKYGVGPTFKVVSNDRNNTYDYWKRAWEVHSNLLKDFKDDPSARALIIGSPSFILDIKARWGIENTRDYLKAYSISLIQKPTMQKYYLNKSDYYQTVDGRGYYTVGNVNIENSPLHKANMQYENFKNYTLYDAYRMGYANNWDGFFREWFDTLRMQERIYGKIKNKYPDYLQTEHDSMSYKYNIMKEEIDERKLKENLQEAKKYEGKVGNYVFIAPTCRQDFLDEAEMQQNCLASYVQRVINGDCIIMFMRDKDDIEHSLVTIEIVRDSVVQMYQSRNRQCTEEQIEAIAKWEKDFNKKTM